MKRTLLVLAVAAVSFVAAGCRHHNLAGGPYCGRCGGMASRPSIPEGLPVGYQREICPPGPPSAATAYPYYTVRGPRDFLQNDPPSIGL